MSTRARRCQYDDCHCDELNSCYIFPVAPTRPPVACPAAKKGGKGKKGGLAPHISYEIEIDTGARAALGILKVKNTEHLFIGTNI